MIVFLAMVVDTLAKALSCMGCISACWPPFSSVGWKVSGIDVLLSSL